MFWLRNKKINILVRALIKGCKKICLVVVFSTLLLQNTAKKTSICVEKMLYVN